MDVTGGAGRMQFAGRWTLIIALIGSGLWLSLSLLLVYLPAGRFGHGIGILEFLPLFFPMAIFGALLWLAGWIVEGFAKKDQ